MLNKCHFNQTKHQFFVTTNVTRAWRYNRFASEMHVSGTSRKHAVISLFVNVFKIHEICYFYLLVSV